MLKPNVFVRGHWKRTDIAQRLLSPKNYLIYTRCVGIFFILSGLVWLFLQSAAESRHRNPNIGVVTFASNQSMKPTAPLGNESSEIVTAPLDFIQAPGFPSAIRVFALTHSRRNVVQRYP